MAPRLRHLQPLLLRLLFAGLAAPAAASGRQEGLEEKNRSDLAVGMYPLQAESESGGQRERPGDALQGRQRLAGGTA